jgi:hypothetical protein
MDQGKVLRQAATDDLRNSVKRLIAPIDAAETLRSLPGLLDFTTHGRQCSAVVEDITAARVKLSSSNIDAQEISLNLDEIFEAFVIGQKDGHHAEPSLERVA